jgi:hypothetical protein
MAGFPGCGSDNTPPTGPDKPPAGIDTIAPAATNDLRVKTPTYQSVALVWTSPGDDGTEGRASKYDIRFSRSAITEENWADAVRVDTISVPVPKPAGQIETVVLRGLDSGTRYYFALTTIDEAENCSDLSNCASERTLDESIPPSNVIDLTARAVGGNQFELKWTAPGDDYSIGTASRYDIRYSRQPIVDDTEWNAATQLGSLPAPKPSGEKETLTVEVSSLNDSYVFALRAADDLDNWSGLSNSAPALGFDDDLWATPSTVHTGRRLYVCFRTPPTGTTQLSIDDGWLTTCCGPVATACLASGNYAEGIYLVTFDFCDGFGDCLPFDVYWIYLCWNEAEHKKTPLYFEP